MKGDCGNDKAVNEGSVEVKTELTVREIRVDT